MITYEKIPAGQQTTFRRLSEAIARSMTRGGRVGDAEAAQGHTEALGLFSEWQEYAASNGTMDFPTYCRASGYAV
jgi:hypothetical protein